MNLSTDGTHVSSSVTSNQKVVGRLVTILVFFWVLGISFGLQGAAWLGPALGDLFSVKPNPACLLYTSDAADE